MVFALIFIFIIEAAFIYTASAGRVFESRVAKRVLILLSVIHLFAFFILLLRIALFKGEFASNAHLNNILNSALLFAVGTLPMMILLVFSNISWLFRKRYRSARRIINRSGIILATLIIILTGSGSINGRFNFKVEKVKIRIKDLPTDLKGLRIVQLSDLHLSSFYRHEKKLVKVMKLLADLKPDILVNTGDYVSFGYSEMEEFSDLLKSPETSYGSYAVLGNHDMGTYHPGWDAEDRGHNVREISEMIKDQGFQLLIDENQALKIGDATISIIGITTSGSIPNIDYGNFLQAFKGADTTDIRIFLSHDPNYWLHNPGLMQNIELTLSGHTHGMQMGIITRWFRFSPASLLYKDWGGLYTRDDSNLYVNRGLGTIGFPFRIGMPPEITLITLE